MAFIVVFVFSLGIKVGEFKAEFGLDAGGSYGRQMMRGGDYFYGNRMMGQYGVPYNVIFGQDVTGETAVKKASSSPVPAKK